MEIKKTKNGASLEIRVAGRLDTATSPALEAEVKPALGGISELVFDFKDLDYVSSAGLRVLLSVHKIMAKQGSMVIKNVSEDIMEVFEITGFSDILTII